MPALQPYVKMTLTLFALWAPPSLLPAGRRGAYLFFFDAFGKWSFFDVLLLHLLMAGFKLGFDVPSVPELPPDACGNALPLVSIATEVAPLEKVRGHTPTQKPRHPDTPTLRHPDTPPDTPTPTPTPPA